MARAGIGHRASPAASFSSTRPIDPSWGRFLRCDSTGIFHYLYALLHHPECRERYAANLKRELPRIPFAPDFTAFAIAGKELARLHVEYESLDPWR